MWTKLALLPRKKKTNKKNTADWSRLSYQVLTAAGTDSNELNILVRQVEQNCIRYEMISAPTHEAHTS